MELFKLFGTIAINNTEANEAIDDTVDKAEQSETKISAAFKKVGAAVVTYFAVDKIKDFGLNCINAASNAQAMESQFTQVFGDMEGQASQSLASIADNTGILENRMKGSYTQIAAFAKTTGMDTSDALSLADRAIIAVADSAAFYDRSLEDTTASLQSFLKGNYENDAALGLSCTETTRNATANKLYGKSFDELNESQKQLTLLQMVEDANEASGALGQAARESDTWTNQTGNLKQAWTDFLSKIGLPLLQAVLPVLSLLITGIQNLGAGYDVLCGWVMSFGEWISSASNWLRQHETLVTLVAIAIGALTAAIIAYNTANAIRKAGGIAHLAQMAAEQVQTWASTAATTAHTAATTLATAATSAFGAVMAFVTSPITLVVLAIGALIAIIYLLVKNWDTVSKAAKAAWDFIVNVFKNAANWFNTNIVQPIVSFFKGLWESITSGASAAWSGIKSAFSSVTSWFKDKFSAAWTAVKKVFSTGGKIFDGIKDGIAKTFTTVVNGIIGGINRVIAVPFNAINGVLNKIRNVSIVGAKPFSGFWKQDPLAVPQIPLLEEGAVLERGQVGLLEGKGAEAVVPLHNNKKWIHAVAEDFKTALAEEDRDKKLDRIIKLLETIIQLLPEIMNFNLSINNREFARLVRQVN